MGGTENRHGFVRPPGHQYELSGTLPFLFGCGSRKSKEGKRVLLATIRGGDDSSGVGKFLIFIRPMYSLWRHFFPQSPEYLSNSQVNRRLGEVRERPLKGSHWW